MKSQHRGHFFTLWMYSLHGARTFVIWLLALAGWRRHSHTSQHIKLQHSGTNSYFTFLFLALCLIHMLQAKISAPQLVSSGACAPFMHCLRQQTENVSSYTLHWRYFCFLFLSWKLQDSLPSGGKENDSYYCLLLHVKIGRKDETELELRETMKKNNPLVWYI